MRWSITSLLMGVSFAVGATLTAIVAAALLLPIAATGLTMGVVGMAQAGSAATINALYLGDSETRMPVLTQLKQSFAAQPTQTFDESAMAWIMPALEQCRTDTDPEVVALADELAAYIQNNTKTEAQ